MNLTEHMALAKRLTDVMGRETTDDEAVRRALAAGWGYPGLDYDTALQSLTFLRGRYIEDLDGGDPRGSQARHLVSDEYSWRPEVPTSWSFDLAPDSDLIVVDPCHLDSGDQVRVTGRSGHWLVEARFEDGRVARLEARHEDATDADLSEVGCIDVDAGLCWIGDAAALEATDPKGDWHAWLDAPALVGGLTRLGSRGVMAEADDSGVLSSTGYGDGFYPVRVARRDDVVEHVVVTFIEDEC